MRLDIRQEAYGPLSIKVNGQEVADRCFLVDTDAGEAHCYVSTTEVLLDEEGNLQTEVLRGTVVVEPRPIPREWMNHSSTPLIVRAGAPTDAFPDFSLTVNLAEDHERAQSEPLMRSPVLEDVDAS